nr:hypothetical protein [Enterococcus faecium]
MIRPEVAEQLAELKQAGAKHLVMLTGDNQMTADYRSEEHTSELQSRPKISYAVFCLKKKKKNTKII